MSRSQILSPVALPEGVGRVRRCGWAGIVESEAELEVAARGGARTVPEHEDMAMRKISNAIVLAITTVALVTSSFPAAAIAEGLEATQSASATSVTSDETSGTTLADDGAEQADGSQQPSGETGDSSNANGNASSDADSSSSADSTAAEDAAASDAAAIALASETPASETTYAHEDSATSGTLTVTVQWNDPVLGEPTTFHVSATGGSGSYKYYMAAPAYASTGESYYSSVPDPSRGEYTTYSDVCESKDFTFTMTASGTYFYKFYVMDMGEKPYKTLNTRTYVAVSDDAHPSVTSIVNSAVAQARSATDGSEYAMALYLHDWLLDQLEYDDSLTWASAEAALTRHTGTCQAYTNAYIKLLNAAGIENAETRDTYDGHTWNAVKLDGEWYQVDCTWDDNDDTKYYGFDARHLYFAITDELMAVAHKGHANIYTADGYATRSTSLTDNYYVRSGLASQWADAYAERIQTQLNAKATSFSITSDNAYNPPSIIGIQNAVVAYAMSQKDWTTSDGTKVELTATSNVTTESSTTWTAEYEFEAEYASLASIRLGGNTRYDTMQAIVNEAFPSSDVVVIASGENFPDALSASSLAGAYNAPVLMTANKSLSTQTLSEIQRLNARKAYIIGSKAVVSASVETTLRGMGLSVERVAGGNRQETAIKVAEKTTSKTKPSTVIIAAGSNFPDALSISPYAYSKGYPIYLTDGDGSLSTATLNAISSLGTVDRIIIVGSSSVVKASAETALGAITSNIERWYGANRYETSLKIAENAVADGMSWSTVVIASGENFPDGLSGASLAGKNGGLLLLTPQGSGSATATALSAKKALVESCYILGSEGAVSSKAKSQIDEALK